MKKIRKIIIILLGILFITVDIFIYKQLHTFDRNMPDIIFTYQEHLSNKAVSDTEQPPYELWAIDRNGNIYHTYDLLADFKEPSNNYDQVGSVSKQEVKEKYILAKQMIKDNCFKLKDTSNYNPDNNCDSSIAKLWNAYCYNTLGEVIQIDLYAESDIKYYNENPEAKELTDWITHIIRQYEK